MMLTPSGRFKPNTRLCLSISDFHPESWNPMWGVSAVLTGLLSFMLEETPTTGAVESPTPEERRAFAADSLRFNMETPTLRGLFPDLPRLAEEARAKREAEKQGAAAAGGASGGIAAAASAAADALAKALRLAGPAPGAAGGAGGGDNDDDDASTEDDTSAAADSPDVQAGPLDAGIDVGVSAATASALAAIRDALAAAAPEEARSIAEAALATLHSSGNPAAPTHAADHSALLRAAAAAAVAVGEFGSAVTLLTSAAHGLAGPGAAAAAASAAACATSAEGAKNEGNEAFKRRDWAASSSAYRRGLEATPRCAALHANLAAAAAASGDAAGAEAAARAALALQAGHHKARRRLADALLARGEADEAAAHYAQLTAALPADEGLRKAAQAAAQAAQAAADAR